MQINSYNYTYIKDNTTTQVATGQCTLVAIVVNTAANGAVGIIDGTSGSTVNVGQLKASVVEGTYTYNTSMSLGIRIAPAAATDLTIIWTR